MSRYTDEEKAAIMAEARANCAAPRFDHTNVIIMKPRPEPVPEEERVSRTFSDTTIQRMVNAVREETANQFATLRAEIENDVHELLVLTTRHYLDEIADVGDKVLSLQGDTSEIRRKFVETDVSSLQADVTSLRADLNALRQIVDALAGEVAALRDDVASVERSAKVITHTSKSATGGGGAL